MAFILVIKQQTYFKLRPQQVSSLEATEKVPVEAGATYELHSYAYADPTLGSFNGHIKFALKDTSIQGLNTWFVFTAHIQVEQDGVVVYPIEDQVTVPVLWVTEDTVFKRRPLQSTALPPAELADVKGGTQLFLHSYAFADNQGNFANHVKIALRDPQDYIRGFNTWFVYEGHCYVEYDGEVVYPLTGPNTPTLRVTQNTRPYRKLSRQNESRLGAPTQDMP